MKTSRSVVLGLLSACVAGGLWYWNAERARPGLDERHAAAAGGRAQAQAVLAEPQRQAREAAPSAATTASDSPAIFSFVERPALAGQLEKCLPAGARWVSYARVDQALLEGKRSPLWKPAGTGVFTLPLPDGRSVLVRVTSSEMLDAERFVAEGVIEGQPGSRVILAGGAQGQFSMEIMETISALRDGVTERGPRMVVMAPTGTAEMLVYEVDPSKAPPCGGQLVPNPDSAQLAELKARRVAAMAQGVETGTSAPGALSAKAVSSSGYSSPFTASATAGVPQVDVLFLYSESVFNSQFGGTDEARLAAIQTRVATIVASTNSDMARSGVNLSIRAVAIEAVSFDEKMIVSTHRNSTALGNLSSTTDGILDGVHERRDAVGADLVCLMLNEPDSTSIGIAYMLTSPTVKATRESLINDYFAFSVVTYGYTTGYNLVSHELGHNFGAQHDRENAYSTDSSGQSALKMGAFSYSYGYRFTGQDGVQYRTIMAYAPGARLSYFSNPNITASEPGINRPVGVAEGLSGEAYNAKTLNESGFEISQWRHQTTDPVAKGTLVNVATRALVGVGEQQLTAGFAIEGTGEKEVLIRGVGPSLIPFGVAGVVSDPWIELTAISTMKVKATADDWKKEANTGAISEATTQLSAFALSSEKDAAMLLKLSPGLYTAKIEGVGGATGIGMVEVYETANPGTAKLVNLSTRAFASKSKEMVGGFVISGEPGTTKRILLRAQGPTLGNYGIKEPMTDPYLELYRVGASLKYLMACDDWTASSGQVDDEHPTATFYDEKAIMATGFAPKNRREPALLVDLEPGLYTVVVTPFQSLSSVPADNSPEKPGVAIVEVFEIKP